jgi:hypothetical protein
VTSANPKIGDRHIPENCGEGRVHYVSVSLTTPFEDDAEHLPHFIEEVYSRPRLDCALRYLNPQDFEDEPHSRLGAEYDRPGISSTCVLFGTYPDLGCLQPVAAQAIGPQHGPA